MMCCAWFWFSVAMAQQAVAARMMTPEAARARHMRIINRRYRRGSREWRDAVLHSEMLIEEFYGTARRRRR